MSNKKAVIEKETFNIEIQKESFNSNQSTRQLQSWGKLFECLSKHTEAADAFSKQSNIRKLALRSNTLQRRKSFFFVGRTV